MQNDRPFARPLCPLLVALATVLLAPLLAALPAARANSEASAPGLRAGVGVVDATWHVGAAAGQYASENTSLFEAIASQDEIDPHQHSRIKEKSYGVQSRLSIRALVVEDKGGNRVAMVKSDNYLAQDMLVRRVAQLLDDAGTSGIGYEQIVHSASHNHSSPYYATAAFGVWVFEDVVDLRMFEYQARAMAKAIEDASASLTPARIGATVVEHAVMKGNIVRESNADDGSPAGYPEEEGDLGLTVMRVDHRGGDADGEPIATWINFGQHPETLDSYNLITADYIAPLERFVEEDTGAPLLFSQGDVGSAEGPSENSRAATQYPLTHEVEGESQRAFAHTGFAMAERGARLMADDVVDGFTEIGAGGGTVPYQSDVPVGIISRWVPGPLSHPYPSVSNCKTDTTTGGAPGAPVLGLPDCAREGSFGPDANPIIANLEAHGIPVPDHYDAPGFTAVEENARIYLQVARIGEILLASCSCEAQVDLIKNLESRANDVPGDIYDGFAWDETCGPSGFDALGEPSRYHCQDPNEADRSQDISAAVFDRMRAQIHNDARGWDAPENALAVNSEPVDPELIWGNFTKEELSASPGSGLAGDVAGVAGFALPVGLGHAGDYIGYTVSYREYMRGDHYRKALTSYGPHTADYLVTRLVRMAAELRDGIARADVYTDAQLADEARQAALAAALGNASGPAYDAWIATLPNDRTPGVSIVGEQPTDITRFESTSFVWLGGNNAVDNPTVTVERRVDDGGDSAGGTWVVEGDMTGEVQTVLEFPEGFAGLADANTGEHAWKWAASFEAFSSLADGSSTPTGTYRFVVEGAARQGFATVPYRVISATFEVAPYAASVSANSDDVGDAIAVALAPVTYPRAVADSGPMAGFILSDASDGNASRICRTCSFRPWATRALVTSATVLIDGDPLEIDVESGSAAISGLGGASSVVIPAGGILDMYGNTNVNSLVLR